MYTLRVTLGCKPSDDAILLRMSFIFSNFEERFLANAFVIQLIDSIHTFVATHSYEHLIQETAWEVHYTSASAKNIGGVANEIFIMPNKDLEINLAEILQKFGIPLG